MTAIANVLCPIDRSDVSRRAIRVAVGLAASHGARLRVIEVIESGRPIMTDGTPLFELQEPSRAALEEELNWFVAPLVSADVPTDIQLRQGSIVTEILREAEALTAPVIVMGTHGRGGFERFVLGSVTEKVLRKAPCPVLAVPAPEVTPEPSADFRRIVCALDFSDASSSALAYSTLLATPTAANVSLLHVLEWPFGEPSGPGPIATLRENLEAEARDQLAALATDVDARVAERVVRGGKPSREIVAFARERDASLIVLGRSGRGAVNQAILGATAHHVVREAPCAVMVVG